MAKKTDQKGEVINKIDVASLEKAHDLVREAMVLVTKCKDKDFRSEIVAALNGLKKADQWLGEAAREAPGKGKDEEQEA